MKKRDDRIVRIACRIARAAFRSCFCDGKAGKTFAVAASCATVVMRMRMAVVVVARVATVSVDEHTAQGFVVWREAVHDSVSCMDPQDWVVTANSRCSCDLSSK